MKKLLFTFFAFIFILSCRGEDEIDTAFLLGNWNWISTTGGIGNINETPTSTGKTIVLNFTADNKYSITTNGTVTSSGSFSLYKDITNTDHSEKTFISFSNDGTKILANYSDTNLQLVDDSNDGLIYIYEKE